jgi:hypothetical protein
MKKTVNSSKGAVMPITRAIVRLVFVAAISLSLSACLLPPPLPPVVMPPPAPVRLVTPVAPVMMVPVPAPFPPVPPVSPVGAATPAPYGKVVPSISFASAAWIAGCSNYLPA